MSKPADQIRGIRNNNPGNIRHGASKWQGMAEIQPDRSFVTFKTAQHGIRALCKCLIAYISQHGIDEMGKPGIDTVTEVIQRWAPPNENDTGAYVASVAKRIGVGPTDHIEIRNRDTLAKLAAAIIAHECANYSYPDDVLQAGVDAALGMISLPA